MEMCRKEQSGTISRVAKKCAVIALPFAFVLSLLLLFPQQAFASGGTGAKHKPLMTHHVASEAFVRCSGNGCNGNDPYAMGCGSSFYAVAGVEAKNVRVELEYSPICQTNWTQVYRLDHRSGYLSGCVGRKTGLDGGATFRCFSSTSFWWINTDMLYASHNSAQACGNDGNPFGVCTDWY